MVARIVFVSRCCIVVFLQQMGRTQRIVENLHLRETSLACHRLHREVSADCEVGGGHLVGVQEVGGDLVGGVSVLAFFQVGTVAQEALIWL